jgi:hypothetical protein
MVDRRPNHCGGVQSGRGILLTQELERALDVLKPLRRIGYFRCNTWQLQNRLQSDK